MRITSSIFTRRTFLNSLLGGWLGALGASLLSPIIKFAFPPYREPDEVKLPLADYRDLAPNTAKTFPWGNKPGILKKIEDGTLQAFVAVCSHLDCNVAYISAQRKFFCACHEGWYDENGVNIAGPPPKPLRRLEISVDGEDLIIRRPGFTG
jgi:cytochrome b6-f complex iron-sulfur subunit